MMEKSAVPYDTMSTKSVSSETMFTRCCCCIPLRVGCFILGYIALIANFLRSLLFIGVTFYCGLKTHGFEYMDPPSHSVHSTTSSIDVVLRGMDKHSLYLLGWGLAFITVSDLIWLAIHIACIVGIHKKRPGPIRVLVGFATFRLVLHMISYMYHISGSEVNNPHHIVIHCIDLGLAAYFILVYYIYAMRLQKEALQKAAQTQQPTIDSIYPTKQDKEYLVV